MIMVTVVLPRRQSHRLLQKSTCTVTNQRNSSGRGPLGHATTSSWEGSSRTPQRIPGRAGALVRGVWDWRGSIAAPLHAAHQVGILHRGCTEYKNVGVTRR